MNAIRAAWWLTAAMVSLLVAGCGPGGSRGGAGSPFPARGGQPTFDIISGSENEALEPILQRFGREQGREVRLHYQGSIDIMLELEQGSQLPYDAVWPANALWITLGDAQKVVKHQDSIMHSPVVFGVKRSLARKLNWLDREITIADVLQAADAGQFSFAMTSATQSNSGASAYLGFLHALAGAPDVRASCFAGLAGEDPPPAEADRSFERQQRLAEGPAGGEIRQVPGDGQLRIADHRGQSPIGGPGPGAPGSPSIPATGS
jgi:hypothetical protein